MVECCYAVSLMLTFINYPFVLSVVLLSVVAPIYTYLFYSILKISEGRAHNDGDINFEPAVIATFAINDEEE